MNQKKAIKRVLKENPSKLLIQAPAGLLKEAQAIGRELSKQGIETIYSAEPCYGACDLRDDYAKKSGCDLLLHLGHADFGVKEAVSTIYLPWKESAEWRQPLRKEFHKLEGYESVGLVASANFTHLLPRIKKWLETRGKKCMIANDGKILGCDLKAARLVERKVDCFLCVGSGAFHPLGLSMESRKVFGLDLERQELRQIKAEILKKQKAVAISRAKDATRWGILVSQKPGQLAIEKAEQVKKLLLKKGKQAFILLLDEIKPEKLQLFDYDGWINCACPRVALDDRARFKKPILNPDEIKEAKL